MSGTPTEQVLVVDERSDAPEVGPYMGQVKWFNPSIGYGFVTVINGDLKGKDVFCHHSGIKPTNSSYRTIEKGEYIQFKVCQGLNGNQAEDITGILGGPLMCDCVVKAPRGIPPPPASRLAPTDQPYPPHHSHAPTPRFAPMKTYMQRLPYVPAPESAFAQRAPPATEQRTSKRPPKNKLKYSKEGREIMKAMKVAAMASKGLSPEPQA